MAVAIETLDPNFAATAPDSTMLWYNILHLGVEGLGWAAPECQSFYDRLPARAEGQVPNSVWSLSHHSAGMYVRFVTDATTLGVRWTLRSERLAMNHMPATGVSGLDLYCLDDGKWRWLAGGRPAQLRNEVELASQLRPGQRQYMLYLPLYNGVVEVELGVNSTAGLAKAPAWPGSGKAICFYGTSIVHGGCASRPGMAYPAIVCRHLNRPMLNFGFSGNGQMQPAVIELLAELDPAVYVLDCLPNMQEAMITERLAAGVRHLRAAHPQTPIVLVDNIVYQNGYAMRTRFDRYTTSNAAQQAILAELRRDGLQHLYHVPADQLLGDDGEATVDGTHPTDVGFMRMAAALEPVLRPLVETC